MTDPLARITAKVSTRSPALSMACSRLRPFKFIVLLLFLLQLPQAGYADDPTVEDDEIPDTYHPAWMAWIPDETYISAIAMPGTHDTMTFKGTGASTWTARTQRLTLFQQLISGIRVLDIRLVNNRDRLQVNHGSINLDQSFAADVLPMVRLFLLQNPTETVVMRVQDTRDGNNDDLKFWEAVNRDLKPYIDEELVWHGYNRAQTIIPQLGDVRGKIVILDDFPLPADANPIERLRRPSYGIKWQEDAAWMKIQDDYNFDQWYRLLSIFDHWDDLQADHQENAGHEDAIWINFISASKVFNGPKDYADYINPRIFRALTGDSQEFDGRAFNPLTGLVERVTRTTDMPEFPGWVLMDFPGGPLIDAIIAYNFRLQADMPAYLTDLNMVMSVVPHGLAGNAKQRHDQLKEFFQHIMPGRYLHLFSNHAPSGCDNWAFVTDQKVGQMYADSNWYRGYRHLSFTSSENTSVVPSDYLQGEFDELLARARFIVNLKYGEIELCQLARTMHSLLRISKPNVDWTVIARRTPLGDQNWQYSYFGSGYRDNRSNELGFDMVIWSHDRETEAPPEVDEPLDSDEDGFPDIYDDFPEDPTEDTDADGDGIGDNADQCDNTPAETQVNAQGCADRDGDGTADSEDEFPDAVSRLLATRAGRLDVVVTTRPELSTSSCSLVSIGIEPFVSGNGNSALDFQVGFTLAGCATGESVEIEINFGQQWPPGAQLFKVTGNKLIQPISIESESGTSVTYTLTDNGPLDTNPADGVIADPVTMALTLNIPTLPYWLLVPLAALLAALGVRRLQAP